MNLNPTESKFFECLKNVDPDSIWGLAIQLVVEDGTEERFRNLVTQLKSQDFDAPQIMQEILTPECYQTLQEL